jgi:3-methyladenine DNA glycosylase/8-oxoguanine DNA glycosylase
VLAAGGKLGGFSADGGVATKQRLLAIEGVQADETLPLFHRAREQRRAARRRPSVDGNGAFGFDPRLAVAHVRASDPVLARVIDAVGPFRMQLKQKSSPFAMLTEAIVYQQLTGKAAATIFARLCALFPRTRGAPTAVECLRISDAKLRGAGLSRSKVLSLRDLAQKTAGGAIPTLAALARMEDQAIIERLTEVRGIGRWTAEMLLMFRLGRPDVLPADDYGIRKGFVIAFKKRELPTREAVEQRGARWRPYRTVASWYLWRTVESAKR